MERLHHEINRFKDNGHKGCDPVVAGALQRLIDSGAQRSHWSLQAIYQAEEPPRSHPATPRVRRRTSEPPTAWPPSRRHLPREPVSALLPRDC